jgi:ankyrin repeat protein
MPRLFTIVFLFAGACFSASSSSDLQLIEAAKRGDVATIPSLLKKHADVNAVGPDGTSALQWAAHSNQAAAAELLIKGGAKVTAANSFGITPLSEAAVNGNAEIVEILLKAGADANAVSAQGEPALMTAARAGNPEAVRILLKHGAAVDARESWKGQTALMWAAAGNHAEVVKALIKSGANVNARSTEWPEEKKRPSNGNLVSVRPRGGLTPLLFAAREGALASMQVLAKAGADLNLTEPDGTNALVMALINAHYDAAAFLLEAGADPNVADKYGRTALYAAIDMNSMEPSVTRPAPQDSDETRPLDVARAAFAHGAKVDPLLAKPTPGRGLSDDPDLVLRSGATPFIRAAKTGDVAAMQLLLDHGADPRAATKDGVTALMVAAGLGWRYGQSQVPENDSLKAVQFCLEHGADVNAVNVTGETALHGAASHGANDIIRLLAARGAKLDVKDKRSRMPLDIAEGGRERGAVAYPAAAALLKQLMDDASTSASR